MFYTIYKTTNNIDGKYYIGKHKTQNLNDNYLGSGKILQRAINKYGVENFTKEYLFIFDNEEDMDNKEKELVCENFIKEDTNYNLKVGGEGGWDFINDNNLQNQDTTNARRVLSERLKSDKAFREKMHKIYAENFAKANLANPQKGCNHNFYGKKHTDEAKAKMGAANSLKQKGSKNSQFGTMWIYSTELRQSKKINKNDPIPEGWHKGRKLKF